jgi:1-acyl-sn-glycerol-3-phosphate acyltransferase
MNKSINKTWRIFATGLCFFVFAIGGLFLSLIIFPLQNLMLRDADKQKKMARKTVHYTFKFFITLMTFTGVFRFSLSKAQQLKTIQGRLVLTNHPSLIDVVVLISMIPDADCVVKTHLFSNVFLRGAVKSAGYISNADPEGLLEDCKLSLAAGNNLIIFPQGTRTKPDETLYFQRGAANIAIRCQAKVTVVLLKVAPSTLTKLEPWYKIPNEKAHFSAEVIDNSPELLENSAAHISKNVREYNRRLEKFFIEELQKYE